ncbi:MAG: hypothetical protein ABIU58_04825 [Ramlibacter sp.]
MKKILLICALGSLTGVATQAGAQEVGRVISSTPVVQQVAVPRQVCSQQQVMQQPSSGGGAVLGAIVGGLLGNGIGHGMGRAAATGVGIVAGAAVGDNIEGRNYPQAVQQCSTQTTYENRTVAYNVSYEYAGKEYSTQMPYDPGQSVRLQLSPVGSSPSSVEYGTPPASTSRPMVAAPPVESWQPVGQVIAVQSANVYPAVYPAYYGGGYSAYYGAPYYYPPVGISLNFGFSRGYHHHRGHWR